jgi:hypothetical protein
MANGGDGDPFGDLIGRAIVDNTFRQRLLDQTQHDAIFAEIGVPQPSPAQKLALQNAVTAMNTLYGTFQKGVGAG